MIVKILGFADILAIIALLAAKILPKQLVIIMALYLILKGLLFLIIGGSFTNLIDTSSGLYLVFAAYGISHWIPTTIVVIFILQKAIISLL